MPKKALFRHRGGTGKDLLVAKYAEIRSCLSALTKARRLLLSEGIEVDIRVAVMRLEAKKLLLKQEELSKLQAVVTRLQKNAQKET